MRRFTETCTVADAVIATVNGIVAFCLACGLCGVGLLGIFLLTGGRFRLLEEWWPAILVVCGTPAGVLTVRASLRGRVAWRRADYERRRAAVLRQRRCPTCDYDLRGTTEPRCPECGERFTVEEWPPTGKVQQRV